MSRQPAPPNLVLVGPMGAGKTTVGRLVAGLLGWPFLDMDAELERRFGCPIAEVFAAEGETVFRQAEAALCQELATPAGQVVAAGGGAIVSPANRAALAAGGVLIALTAPPATLLARLNSPAIQQRPLLRGADPAAALAALLARRAAAYAAIALQVDTTGRTPEAVAEAVVDAYRRET